MSTLVTLAALFLSALFVVSNGQLILSPTSFTVVEGGSFNVTCDHPLGAFVFLWGITATEFRQGINSTLFTVLNISRADNNRTFVCSQYGVFYSAPATVTVYYLTVNPLFQSNLTVVSTPGEFYLNLSIVANPFVIPSNITATQTPPNATFPAFIVTGTGDTGIAYIKLDLFQLPKYAGHYVVTMRHLAATTNVDLNLIVLYAPRYSYQPTISNGTFDIYVLPNSTLSLSCNATGVPEPMIHGLNSSFNIATNSYDFVQAMDSDAGLYICVANNTLGSNTITYRLYIGGLCRHDVNVNIIQGTYSWPDTKPGQSVSQVCQYGGDDQNITRFCNTNLAWTEDASKCPTVASVEFNRLHKLIKNETINAEGSVYIVTELLAAVSQVTLPVDQSASNLAVVTDILTKIANMSSQHQGAVSNVVGILSRILQWPPMVVQGNGSIIVNSFEMILKTLVQQTNFTSLNVTENQITIFAEKILLQSVQSSGKHFGVTKEKNLQFTGNNISDPSIILTASVLLPPSLFRSMNGTNVGIFFSVYTTSSFFPLANTTNTTLIASLVLGATVVDEVDGEKAFENLTEPIQLAFTTPIDANSDYICVSWSFSAAGRRGNWTTDGCITKRSMGQILCQCTHLTNFAILVDISRRVSQDTIPIINAFQRTLDVISYIGVSLSIVGLMVTIIALMTIEKLRQKDASKYHVQLCSALIGMLLVFVVGIDRTETFGGCVTVSVLIQYFTLVAVMWMGAEALLMFQKLVIVFVHISTRYIIILSLICWLVPLVPVLVPLAIDRAFFVKLNSTTEFCFISDTRIFFAAFLGPILLVLFFNFIIFIAVTIVLVRHTLNKKSSVSVQMMVDLMGIFILFGLTWIFGALTVTRTDQAFEVVFTVINSFQGFLIFIFFCAMNKDVKLALTEMLKRHHLLPHVFSSRGLKPFDTSPKFKLHGTEPEILETADKSNSEMFHSSAFHSHTNQDHVAETCC